MKLWPQVYASVLRTVNSMDIATPWFRGHADVRWRLLPSLARARHTKRCVRQYADNRGRERGVFQHFVTESGVLLPPGDAWAAAFAMQHHGVPTRLLDWTTSFGVALYFALAGATHDATVWILDPFALNSELVGKDAVFGIDRFPGDYRALFVDRSVAPPGPVVAFEPPRFHPRVFNQKSGFTVHSQLRKSLDVLAPSALKQVVIPKSAHDGARRFLRLAGISEFSLFPDLDGLARDIRQRYF